MRKSVAIVAIMGCICLCSGCAALWQSMAYTDDMYSIHNRTAIAERQRAEAELARAQYEAQQAQYAAINAGIVAAETSIYDYNSVLADTYESAYARRLYGFSSPTYRVPSSYYTWRYSDAFHYASAYDPAFYNIMVSGDMVWVEPKYITSMFGSWGAVAIPAYGWYYGWNDPFYYWSTPYRWSCNFYWNYWYSPYLWSWSLPYHHHHYHPHRPPQHRPAYHRPAQHRPPQAPHGGVGNTGHSHNQPGMVVGRNPGTAAPADRGGSVRPSQPVNNGNVTRPSQPVNNGGVIRPSQPTNNGNVIRPSQPVNNGGVIRPSQPTNNGSVARPSQPANNNVATPRYRNNSPSTGNSGSSSYRGAPSYNNSRGGSYGGSSHGAPSHGGGGSSRGR